MVADAKMPQQPATQKKFAVTSDHISRNAWLSALVNPFASEAVQLPDEYSGGTVALRLVEDFEMVIDANMNALHVVSPALKQATYKSTVGADGIVTLQAPADHPDFVDFNSQFIYFRTLVMGVEVQCTLSDNENQGRIACSSNPNQAHGAIGSSITSVFEDTMEPMSLKEGCLVVSRPVQPPRFEQIGLATAGMGTIPCVAIAISGAKVGSKMSVRVVRLVEGQPTKGSLHRGAATVEPYDMITMGVAANMAMNEPTVHPNTDGGKTAMKAEGMELAKTAVQFLAASLTAVGVLPPGVAAAGTTAYNMVHSALSRRKSRG